MQGSHDLWKLCQDPEGWGPYNLARADFTPCFEHVYLLALPALGAMLWFFLRIVELQSSAIQPYRFGRTNWIYYPSQFVITLAGVALVVLLILLHTLPTGSRLSSPSLIVGIVASCLTWVVALVLNYQEHKYSTRSSDHLFSFYLVSLVSGTVLYSTIVDITASDLASLQRTKTVLTFLKVYLGSILVGFIIEAYPRSNTEVQRLAREKEHQSIYDQASFGSRILYFYVDGLLKLGASRPLRDEDVPDLAEHHILAEESFEELDRVWAHAKRHHATRRHHHSQEASASQPSLLRSIFVSQRRWVGPLLISRLVGISLGYALPECLKYLIRFVEDYSDARRFPERYPDGGPNQRIGVHLAFLMFGLMIASTVLMAYSIQVGYDIASSIRSSLIQIVYRKSLVLSPEARQANTLGAIVNHMSVDAETWIGALHYLPFLVTTPFEILLASFLLYRQMGWSIFGGLAIIILLNPLQTLMGRHKVKAEAAKLAKMDIRVRLMSEILSGIKIIKLYGWEEPFRTKVDGIRQEEIKALKRVGLIDAFMRIVYSSATLPMALVTFALYSTIGGTGGTPGKMTADIIVVSIALFGMLNRPIGLLGHAIGSLINVQVSVSRVQNYLLADEIDTTVIQRYPRQVASQQNTRPLAIELKNATVTWSKPLPQSPTTSSPTNDNETQPLLAADARAITKSGRPTLSNISLTFRQGSLTAIVGRVGQGKSSLLSAIIGEMYKLEGSITLYGSVAYVPQQAWIVHGTLRDNILFGKPYDQAKYERIVHAAGLVPDIAILPAGDQTEIGERGINLSGGQKQRVSIARAAYQDADVYLFDDPLSAVDAHVDQHLWEHLIGPESLLNTKTRVLVTHGIHHLEEVDQIVILKDGAISEVGQYTDLMAHRNAFYYLIKEYSVGRKTSSSKEGMSSGNIKKSRDITDDSSSDKSATIQGSAQTLKKPITGQQDGKKATSQGYQGSKDGGLVSKEKVTADNLGWDLYHRYAKAASYKNVILAITLCAAAQACQIGTNFWLRQWVVDVKEETETGVAAHSTAFYLLVYALLMVGAMVTMLSSNLNIQLVAGLRAAIVVHNQLLCRVLRLPMSFFDTTPVGRILNRFSSDVTAIDSRLPREFDDIFTLSSVILGTIFVVGMSTPAFLILVPPLFLAYGVIQNYYLKTSASIKTMTQVTKSPVYSHFAETISGVSSIRIMDGTKDRFLNRSETLTDIMTQRMAAYMAINRWLQVRLEALGALMVLTSALLSVWNADKLDPALIGIALSYAITITVRINFLVRTVGEIQNMMVSLDRIYEYSSKPTEAPAETGVRLPEHWPQAGHIRFCDYSTRYRQGLDLVVKHISFEVQPGEKIGIVGRTGAGKSSLTLALFRIIEAANSYWAKASEDVNAVDTLLQNNGKSVNSGSSSGNLTDEEIDGGSIVIDGVNIATVGLNHLRQHLAIIPQEPTLFAGSLRENLDPFNEKQDVDIWQALERAHLKDHISTLQGGLNFEVAQNGENFSVGQRSLICLARALLRDTKILVLDEATSSVDMQTDELIQRTIRTEFKDRTILTIAHRIKTVMDYDKILVLEKGQLVEFEPPSVLLQRKDSLFYGLAEQAGEIKG